MQGSSVVSGEWLTPRLICGVGAHRSDLEHFKLKLNRLAVAMES